MLLVLCQIYFMLLKFNNYNHLQTNFNKPLHNHVFTVRYNDIDEDVIVDENDNNHVTFLIDGKKINYKKILFCIEEKVDEENKIKFLSVSKKIIYILLTTQKKMSSGDIYLHGLPWSCTGKTPKNTVIARCSTLFRNGFINKENNLYFI
jgi:hypothetical protein